MAKTCLRSVELLRSSNRLSSDPNQPRAKYKAGYKVSMVVTSGSTRSRKDFTVKDRELQGNQWTYKLGARDTGRLYDGGRYFKEDQLDFTR